MDAEVLMLIAGIVSFSLTIYWVRRRELRERYAIGWIAVAIVLLLCGFFPRPLMRLADSLHLSYPSLVLFFALAAIYVFSLLVTVALSNHYRRNVRLTQDLAIMEHRLRNLERAHAELQSELAAMQLDRDSSEFIPVER